MPQRIAKTFDKAPTESRPCIMYIFAESKLFEREIVDKKSMRGRFNNRAKDSLNSSNTAAAILWVFVFPIPYLKIPVIA